jgi:predicted TIM-barrel fold metal-dependent hydrolase
MRAMNKRSIGSESHRARNPIPLKVLEELRRGTADAALPRGVLGSDFPFGEVEPVELVQSAAKIPEAARQAILGANAARFPGVEI